MSTPPGWYPDPYQPENVRYWDGAGWVEDTPVQPIDPQPEDQSAQTLPSYPPPSSPIENQSQQPISTDKPTDPNMHWDGTRWLRYDGQQWTDAATGLPLTAGAVGFAKIQSPGVTQPVSSSNAYKSPGFTPAKKTGLVITIVAVAVIVLLIIIVAASSVSKDVTTNPPTPIATAPSPASPEQPVAPAPPEQPKETVSQANARESAESYLNTSSFSHSGLIKQLKYEGFSQQDATYGVNALNADWNEQAAKSAESYLNTSSFSRSSLITQLKYEGFSQAQAAHGANSVGL